MKHRDLINSFNSANAKTPSPSGTEIARLSKSQESLLRLQDWKRKHQQDESLARLKDKKLVPVDPSPNRPRYFDPTRFGNAKSQYLYWGEFNNKFGTLPGPYRFSREDFKRYWLTCLGATEEELADITGKKIETIQAWVNSIQNKILHNEWPARWIEAKSKTQISFSGTASPSALGLDLGKQERLDKLHKKDKE